MSFNKFYENLEDKSDSEYDMLKDAWKSGATAMMDRLFDISKIGDAYREKIIDEEVELLVVGEDGY